MKRPAPFTFIALLSGLSAIGSVAEVLQMKAAMPMATAASVSVATAVQAVALWRCLPWAHWAFLATSILGLVNLSTYYFVLGQPAARRVWIGQSLLAGALATVTFLLIRHLLRLRARTAPALQEVQGSRPV